jgi:hypothetical protein
MVTHRFKRAVFHVGSTRGHTTGANFPRSTSVRDMHEAFQILYVYAYITKS